MNRILEWSAPVAFSLASVLAASTGAAEVSPGVMMKPAQTVTLDAGPRRVVISFGVADGQCNLLATVTEAFREHSSEAVRIGATLAPGGASRIDAGGGHLLQFSCKDGAHAMTATMLGEERPADVADHKETFAVSPPALAILRATGF